VTSDEQWKSPIFNLSSRSARSLWAKTRSLRAGQLRGVHNAGVNQLINDDDVILAEQRGDGAQRRGVAGGKSQRGFGRFESGERFLQFVKRRQRAAIRRDAPAPAPNFSTAPTAGRFQRRMIGEAEIVGGGKIEKPICRRLLRCAPCAESTRRSSRNRFCSRQPAKRRLSFVGQ